MIRHIQGKLVEVTPSTAVVDVGGFGVEIHTNDTSTLTLGSPISFATHLVIKQDGIDLYGFSDPADRDFFELTLSVSGIGPKTALGILRKASRNSLEGALGKRDLAYLTKVVGLSKKSAEKMLVELADKLGDHTHDEADNEVFDTLIALGYTEREARVALKRVPEQIKGKEERLKRALSSGS